MGPGRQPDGGGDGGCSRAGLANGLWFQPKEKREKQAGRKTEWAAGGGDGQSGQKQGRGGSRPAGCSSQDRERVKEKRVISFLEDFFSQFLENDSIYTRFRIICGKPKWVIDISKCVV